MITGFIRTTVTTVILLLIFSIKINNKTVFNHIYRVISPITTTLQDGTENLIASSFASVQDYARKLFDNSRPKVRDHIRSKAAAPSRGHDLPMESIPQEDKEALDSLIKNHR